MRFKKELLSLLFSFFIVYSSFSQQKGTVTGILIDADTKLPLSYATVLVLNKVSKASIMGAQTDASGKFSISVPLGNYAFKASNIGYVPFTSDGLALNSTTDHLDFGKINLKAAKSKMLNEVKVVAEKKDMQLAIDKKVFAVDQSLVSEGGSAADLLQNVPSIQTDVDGNISLRGASPQVLINGKPSTIGGGDIAQILQSIPANAIDKVEVITNPSSKFDAAGQSGIINIVLKKNARLGYTGSVNAGIGNRDSYTGGLNIAFQNSKVNIYGNYSTRGRKQYEYGYNNRNNLLVNNDDVLKYIKQNSNEIDKDQNHNIVAGIDYYVSEKTILGISGGLNTKKGTENENINFDYLTRNDRLLNINKRFNGEQSNNDNYYVNLDATHKFKKPNEEIIFNFNYGWGNRTNDQDYTTTFYDAQNQASTQIPQILNSNSISKSGNYNIQLDYTLPLSNGKFEAGARSQIQNSDRSFLADSIVNQVSQFAAPISNLFTSTNQIHAIYSNFQQKFGKFGYQLGLRLEKADLETNLGSFDAQKNISYTPGGVHYLRLYPSAFVSQDLGQKQQLQLSYTRRVERPNPWFINPFKDVSDPINIRQGNPNLMPEDIHSFELAYSKTWSKITLISSAYYRITNDVVQFIRRIDEEGITTSRPENFARATNKGFEFIGQFNLTNFWNFNTNVNLYQTNIQGKSDFGIVDNSGFSWNANMTNNFKLPKNISLQVRIDYRSPQVMAQGSRKEMFGVDFGAKYAFFKNKASVSLNIRDVFKTRRFGMITDANTFTMDFQRYRLGQQAMLVLSYNFGTASGLFKKANKSKSDSSGGNDEETSPM